MHYSNKRQAFRTGGGQFRESSLESDFGLRTCPCPKCGAVNPYGRKDPVEVNGFIDPTSFNQWDKPEKCEQCGEVLP